MPQPKPPQFAGPTSNASYGALAAAPGGGRRLHLRPTTPMIKGYGGFYDANLEQAQAGITVAQPAKDAGRCYVRVPRRRRRRAFCWLGP